MNSDENKDLKRMDSDFVVPTKPSTSNKLDLKEHLKEKFNISEFRTHQEQIITDIFAKRDLLVLMPTGGGKSLCYQLSSLISPGFSLIISPLIALIWDQIADLKEKGIDARAWSSDLDATEMFELKDSIKSGKVKILYTTPEMLMQSSNLNNLLILNFNGKPLLDRIIVDEAHCVSNWGHEFRDSYLELVNLKKKLPGVQIVAFTATATPAVQLDIIRILNLSKVKIYRQSYIRENLHYFVKKREASSKLKFSESFVDEICQWIRENDYLRKTGIIYCLSRDNSEELAAALQERGLSAEFFHASMSISEKKLTQTRWLAGETKIIVATIAFALGINKPNVRFVIHAALPKSIEGFYQETGRAGRDGKLSRCLLFYNRQDKHILQSMAKKSMSYAGLGGTFRTASQAEKTTQAPTDSFTRTEDMYQWANSNLDCRIESLSRYLGENVIYACGNCDNCRLTSSGNRHVKPIKRSIKDFLVYAVNSIQNDPRGFRTKEELLEDISTNLSHYAGYDRFRVLAQLEALGYLIIKFQLDKDNEIHANVILGPRAESLRSGNVEEVLKAEKDPELMMNFSNGTLDNYVYVPSRV